MDPNYFEGVHRALFKEYVRYVAKYSGLPSIDAFRISMQETDTNLSEEVFRHAMDILPDLFTPDEATDLDWLLENTEKFCQDRALFNAVMESISIIDGKHQSLSKNALPEILSKALAVTFDTNIGHDYLENAEQRYAFYHEQEERTPFDLDYLNRITKGGIPNKSLNIVLAGTVLYITLEMAEERIAERIDANLLDIPIDQIEGLSRDMFVGKVDKVAQKTHGKLIIKEYPTGQAHSAHFRALLNELKLKKKFTPDVLFIDYLNICSSSRMKGLGGSINTYSFIKAIAEELRGLAVEFNLPVVSATQTTRAGYGSSDPGLEDTSESFGLPATADLMIALVSNEELQANNQILVKQLKNRYSDPNVHKRFVVGVDRSKMKLFDVEDPEKELVDDTVQNAPVFDNTPAGKKLNTEGFVL